MSRMGGGGVVMSRGNGVGTKWRFFLCGFFLLLLRIGCRGDVWRVEGRLFVFARLDVEAGFLAEYLLTTPLSSRYLPTYPPLLLYHPRCVRYIFFLLLCLCTCWFEPFASYNTMFWPKCRYLSYGSTSMIPIQFLYLI